MTVRAKFKVQTNQPSADGAQITMAPVYSGSEENLQFFKATPGGQITLGIVNPSAAEQFEVGGEYYVDFTKAG